MKAFLIKTKNYFEKLLNNIRNFNIKSSADSFVRNFKYLAFRQNQNSQTTPENTQVKAEPIPNLTRIELSSIVKTPEYKQEVIRKIFHILTILFLPLLYIFLNKTQMLMLVFPLSIVIIAADYYRHKIVFIEKIFHGVFGHILRESELEKHSRTGASYMAMAALLVFTICPKSIAICAFSILAVSDCLAALAGKALTSKEFFEKSVAGSIAFGVSALLILIICGIGFNQGFGYYLFGFFAVLATTIIEARPSFFAVDDNFTIPVMFAAIMVFFGFVWNLNY